MEEFYTPENMLYCLQTPQTTISNALPDENSEKLTEKLLSTLSFIQTEEEMAKMKLAFNTLRALVCDWINLTFKKLTSNLQNEFPNCGGDLFAFGSFKLNVWLNDADIDTICIVPKYFKREEQFYGELFEILKNHENITEIFKITEAYIPIIKLKFMGIPFDILFAALNFDIIPSDLNFKDDKILLSLEEKCYRSLNGIRCAVILKGSVPNFEVFRQTLICVKYWAKQKGIYSSLMGYFSGISLSILVAKVCQLYPKYNVSKLLERFFFIYSNWRWDRLCVKICNQRSEFEDQKILLEQFTEMSERTSMNIITPAFPSLNASHAISPTTLKIISSRIKEGHLMINAVRKGKMTWEQFFESYDFFRKFYHFLEINIYSTDEKEFVVWRGSVESKIRRLTKILESFSESNHLDFFPNPICYKNVYDDFANSVTYYFGIKLKDFSNETPNKFDFRPSVMYFKEMIGNPPSEASKVLIRCIYQYSLPSIFIQTNETRKDGFMIEFGREIEEFEQNNQQGKENFNRNSI